MSKRRTTKVNEDTTDDVDHLDSNGGDDQNNDGRSGGGGHGKDKASKKQGYNFYAILIIAMFVVPGIIGASLYLVDYIYPEAAAARKIKERVAGCYEIANPSKMADVDKFIAKYKGRESALYAQLRNKYHKVPDCQLY